VDIDVQINSGFQNGTEGNSSENLEHQRYYARLSGEINDELSDKTDVDRLKTLGIMGGTTAEQFSDALKYIEEDTAQPFNGIDAAKAADEEILSMLMGYDIPVSLDNIEAAQLLISDRNSLFRQAVSQGGDDDDNDSDNDDDVLEKADEFIGGLGDGDNPKENAALAYSELIKEAVKELDRQVYAPDEGYIDVRAAQSLFKGLSLAGNLAREENYQVPMDIGGEITTVNLKLYHNASKAGKVSVTLETDSLGKVAAEFDVTNERISGMVVYDNKSSGQELEALGENIKQGLGSLVGDGRVNVSLVQSDKVDFNKFGTDREKGEDSVATRDLYQVAKTFLTALKNI
jgi:hypothetical protein